MFGLSEQLFKMNTNLMKAAFVLNTENQLGKVDIVD